MIIALNIGVVKCCNTEVGSDSNSKLLLSEYFDYEDWSGMLSCHYIQDLKSFTYY